MLRFCTTARRAGSIQIWTSSAENRYWRQSMACTKVDLVRGQPIWCPRSAEFPLMLLASRRRRIGGYWPRLVHLIFNIAQPSAALFLFSFLLLRSPCYRSLRWPLDGSALATLLRFFSFYSLCIAVRGRSFPRYSQHRAVGFRSQIFLPSSSSIVALAETPRHLSYVCNSISQLFPLIIFPLLIFWPRFFPLEMLRCRPSPIIRDFF